MNYKLPEMRDYLHKRIDQFTRLTQTYERGLETSADPNAIANNLVIMSDCTRQELENIESDIATTEAILGEQARDWETFRPGRFGLRGVALNVISLGAYGRERRRIEEKFAYALERHELKLHEYDDVAACKKRIDDLTLVAVDKGAQNAK